MKNYEKMPERAYSQPAGKDVIDLDVHEPPPAVKKSSISLPEIQPKAIKKSSLSLPNPSPASPTELVLTSKPKDHDQDRPSKFIKLEKNEKMTRTKKSEDSRLTSLVKMRAKFCNTKGNTSQSTIKQGTPTDPVALFQFSERLQELTGVKVVDSLSNLEFALRFFLRNNSRVLVNSYEFSDKPLFCDIFQATQLKYLEIQSFILSNSKKIT